MRVRLCGGWVGLAHRNDERRHKVLERDRGVDPPHLPPRRPLVRGPLLHPLSFPSAASTGSNSLALVLSGRPHPARGHWHGLSIAPSARDRTKAVGSGRPTASFVQAAGTRRTRGRGGGERWAGRDGQGTGRAAGGRGRVLLHTGFGIEPAGHLGRIERIIGGDTSRSLGRGESIWGSRLACDCRYRPNTGPPIYPGPAKGAPLVVIASGSGAARTSRHSSAARPHPQGSLWLKMRKK